MPDARRDRSRDRGVFALAVIVPVWGYSWIAIKVALGYSGPFTFMALATAGCTGLFLAALLVTRRPLRPPPLKFTVPIGLHQTSLFNILATVALSVRGRQGRGVRMAYLSDPGGVVRSPGPI